jgi:hypothetical protein
MRILRSLFVSGFVILFQALSVHATTRASLVGLQFVYQPDGV